jgi:hypothetical protein
MYGLQAPYVSSRQEKETQWRNIDTLRGVFLNGFLPLREKLAPTQMLDLALFAPRRKVGTYSSFKKTGPWRRGIVVIESANRPEDPARVLKFVGINTYISVLLS